MIRQINAAGLKLIKAFEGCILTPYKDLGGILTIGYGHVIRKGEYFGDGITQEQAERLLLNDLQLFEAAVCSIITTPLTDNQFAALVSLTYNIGTAPLHHTLGDYLLAGNIAKAADEFPKWAYVHIGNKPVESNGLLNRRNAERNLFLTN